MKHIQTLLLVCFGLFVTGIQAQSLKQHVKGAEDALANKDYYSAYNYYRIAHDIEPKNIEITYKLAESARLYSAISYADKYYQEVADSDKANDYPELSYWQAFVKERLGKYEEALALYNIYQTEHSGENEELQKEALKRVESTTWAIDALKDKDTIIELLHLGSQINTAFSEFGSHSKGEDTLYYTSLRFIQDDKNPETPDKPYAKILYSKEEGEGKVDSFINDPVLHTSHTAFNAAKDRVFYTLCEYKNATEIRCDLYYRDVVDGVLGLPQKLPEPINMAGFTSTQPSIGFDPLTGNEVLYFTSDRPGGAGKLDIYTCQIAQRDNFLAPENLVALNTPSSEVSPFWHRESNTLYFSSEGYLGFGGLDIFRVDYNLGKWDTPENLGAPINSSLDDAFYILASSEDHGYFSSNRLGSMYLSPEDEACCFDIYNFSKEPIELTLKVLTFNRHTGEPLDYTTVYINEAGVFPQMYSTEAGNEVTTKINRNTEYFILGEKPEFVPDSAKVSTFGIKKSTEIVRELYLSPAQRILKVRTFEKRTKAPLEGVRVEIAEVPNGLPRAKQDNNAYYYLFDIDPGKDMRATGTKKGYRAETVNFNSSQSPELDTLVIDLYLELGNLEDFLPLAIFFDNDQPGPNSKAETAVKRYLETYNPYFNRRDEFIKKYAAGLKVDEREQATLDVNQFFDTELAKGKREFESFMHILDQYLSEGLTFTIYLKGYTSPLASAAYNLNLGKRRISSIQNEFKNFRNGILWKYMETGDLVVTQKSFGEETAPANVSDDHKNLRKSVFSPEASRERRVEIIEIEK